ncbi:siderophore-interacting protein [uncultured Ruegeria sp.]|uniref:siderophore-interacting protein n=1 Tax=uncultured Ruegeria sp. TaxID=259304 RepID=UPI002622EC48|nr:siderophore-interacting protein [uncultured Ruegeria sp.]
MSKTAVVQSVYDVSPNMRRIVFGGPELADFPVGKEGGYIKLVFTDLPRTTPDRPVMRTYSNRSHEAANGKITVDSAMHADIGGIAIDWASQVEPGDTMLINGPDIEKMASPNAEWYLIAGDMTAQPAAMCNLEILPANAKGYTVLEMTSDADRRQVNLPAGMSLHWVVNPRPPELKNRLLDKIKSLEWLDGDPFVWTACGFDTMRALRTYFRTERRVKRQMLYLSSYWRAGRTEDQHKADKNKDAQADTL